MKNLELNLLFFCTFWIWWSKILKHRQNIFHPKRWGSKVPYPPHPNLSFCNHYRYIFLYLSEYLATVAHLTKIIIQYRFSIHANVACQLRWTFNLKQEWLSYKAKTWVTTHTRLSVGIMSKKRFIFNKKIDAIKIEAKTF